jgi:uncharacterized protein YbdZ (MbtH family)
MRVECAEGTVWSDVPCGWSEGWVREGGRSRCREYSEARWAPAEKRREKQVEEQAQHGRMR